MSAAAAVAEWHRRLAAEPDAAPEQAQRLQQAFAREGVLFGGAPMRTCLRPHFVDAGSWGRVRDDARALLELATRVARRAFDGDVARLAAYLGTPEEEIPWVAHDPGEPDVVWSRLDAFTSPGGARFVEINSDAPAGFGYADRMARAFAELPLFAAVAEGRTLRHVESAAALIDALLAAWRRRGGRERPRVAIVDWAEVPTRADQEILREAFAARGLEAELADPRSLSRRAGALWSAGGRVDMVYRRALLQELLPRRGEARALLDAYREDEAFFVNSFRCRLGEDKALFALLSDEAQAGLLTAAERELTERCVPWTRRVEPRRTRWRGEEIDLVPWIAARRADLVLKPAHGYGGRSVLVGDETAPEAWEEGVNAALGPDPWVVQERLPIPQEPFPVLDASGGLGFEALKLNVNPFYAGAADAGSIARVSRESVINVSAGGGSVPTFLVE